MSRTFETIDPADLVVGDVVKGNCALWKVVGFRPLVHPHRVGDGRLIDEMVECECIDPMGMTPFEVGFRKEFVRQPIGGTWEREIRNG